MNYVKFFWVFLLCLVAGGIARAETVIYEVNGQPYEGYYADAGQGAPLILLIHDWNGLTGYEVQRAQMLADLGYSVFAADLFGAGVRPTEVDDKRRLTDELYNDRKKMRALMIGALAEAGKRGADVSNAVAMGYCFGGAAVLELARSGTDLKGFVTFHGGLSTPEGQDYTKTQGEVLVMHGGADAFVSMDDFTELEKQLESSGIPHEMIVYGGANHAFTVYGGERYNKSADEKSWKRFLQFLNRVLK